MIIDYDTNNETNQSLSPIFEPRNVRNKLLANVDKVNPVWYGSLTSEQQNQLAVYRQALLDVPQQQGFPNSIVWPEKPTWL